MLLNKHYFFRFTKKKKKNALIGGRNITPLDQILKTNQLIILSISTNLRLVNFHARSPCENLNLIFLFCKRSK